jgi:peptidoglycan/LPS O-acetylase OafA/YrhL
VIVTNLVDFEADDLRIGILNANLDSSWSHIATSVTLGVGALIALLKALQAGDDRKLWSAIAVALLLLFIVEVSPLHVQVDALSYGKLIYLPLLAGLVVSVWRLAAGSDEAVLVRAGLASLIVSYAVHLWGMHVVEALGWGSGSGVYQLKVGIKEGAETGGWLALVWALWRLARSSAVSRTRLPDRLGSRRKLARWAIGSPERRGYGESGQ